MADTARRCNHPQLRAPTSPRRLKEGGDTHNTSTTWKNARTQQGTAQALSLQEGAVAAQDRLPRLQELDVLAPAEGHRDPEAPPTPQPLVQLLQCPPRPLHVGEGNEEHTQDHVASSVPDEGPEEPDEGPEEGKVVALPEVAGQETLDDHADEEPPVRIAHQAVQHRTPYR